MPDTDLTEPTGMTGTVPQSKILTTEIPRYVEDYASALAGDTGHGIRRRRRPRRDGHRHRITATS